MKRLVVLLCVQLAISAPLRLLKIRNMTFLFVETPDGERVDVLYAPSGKALGSLPIGSLLGFEPSGDDRSDVSSVTGQEYDPQLDGPRVEPSVIQAPRTESGCGTGRRKDKNGKCRLIW